MEPKQQQRHYCRIHCRKAAAAYYYLLFAEEAVVGHDCVTAHATPVPAVRVVGVLLLHGLQPGLVVALELLLQDLATQLA